MKTTQAFPSDSFKRHINICAFYHKPLAREIGQPLPKFTILNYVSLLLSHLTYIRALFYRRIFTVETALRPQFYDRLILALEQQLSQSILNNPFNNLTPLIQPDLKENALRSFEISLWKFYDQTFVHFAAHKC